MVRSIRKNVIKAPSRHIIWRDLHTNVGCVFIEDTNNDLHGLYSHSRQRTTVCSFDDKLQYVQQNFGEGGCIYLLLNDDPPGPTRSFEEPPSQKYVSTGVNLKQVTAFTQSLRLQDCFVRGQ